MRIRYVKSRTVAEQRHAQAEPAGAVQHTARKDRGKFDITIGIVTHRYSTGADNSVVGRTSGVHKYRDTVLLVHSADLKQGTSLAIIKQAGLTTEEFLDFL